MMNKGIKDKLVSDAFWLKTLYLVMFFLVYRVLDIVLLLALVSQWLFSLITGEPHAALLRFGASLGEYLKQITHYLTQVSDDKPYPFKEWPKPNRDNTDSKS